MGLANRILRVIVIHIADFFGVVKAAALLHAVCADKKSPISAAIKIAFE